MKFSELWLREWVDIELNSKSLYDKITMAGLKVINSEKIQTSEFNDILVGEVIECSRHPNIREIYITKINIGNKLLNIFCDAPNCRQGIKVAVAITDAVLLSSFNIKIKELDNKISEGILCSPAELGISDDHINVIELPNSAPIGINIREYLKLNDNIIEIDITSNRSDCLSIMGIARDIAAFNQTKLNLPDIIPTKVTSNDTIPIQVINSNVCPRYLGRVLKDINIQSITPLWMKERLRRCGVCSVSVIVDIVNYVLIELGQPIHVLDRDQIDKGIIIRLTKKGEILSLSDHSEIKLKTNTLVIADHSKILAICGVFNEKHSNISEKTRNIFLECAFFNPLFIIGSARYYGLYTDAFHRYERGVDPNIQYRAMERVTYLLLNICGGKAGPIINITNTKMLPKRSAIVLRRSKLDRLIGYHISSIQVCNFLLRFGFQIVQENIEKWKVIAPSWRFDIECEEDLVEEIVRIYGYDNIPDKSVRTNLEIVVHHHETDLSLQRVKTMLNDRGYQEVITYSFVNPVLQQLIHPDKEALILPNPLSREMSAMRLSLWSGLLETIIYNQNRQQNRLRIFEAGICFIPNVQSQLNICQNLMLAGAIYGDRYGEHWSIDKVSPDFYDMKGDIESIFDLSSKLSEIEFRAQVIPALHLGQSAAIYLNEECVGFIGVIHPDLGCKLNLKKLTIIFELEWTKIAYRIIPKVKDISRFPTNRSDISVIVEETVPAADVLAECRKAGLNKIVDVNLFDVYKGQGIEKGYKSLSISLILQDSSHTLEEKEITETVTRCIEALRKRFQASLRNEILKENNT